MNTANNPSAQLSSKAPSFDAPTEHQVTLSREEIQILQLAMECLYSELPEYDSIQTKLKNLECEAKH